MDKSTIQATAVNNNASLGSAASDVLDASYSEVGYVSLNSTHPWIQLDLGVCSWP